MSDRNTYNFVQATVCCPTCGERLEMLYTNDDSVEPLRDETVLLPVVRSFYGQCKRCGTRLDFKRRRGAPGVRPSDFTLTWNPDRPRAASRRTP